MIFNLNGTLVVFVISFLIFMWLLNELFLKPVGQTIEKRGKLIEGELDAGKGARAEAQQLLEKYEDDLKRIRSEAQSVITKATEDANKERIAQLERIAADGQKQLDKAKAEIATERERLIDALVAEEAALVETITRKVLGDDSVQLHLDAGQVRRTLEGI
jgi:F-type H+-transporting ATPase subunit b